MDDLIGPFSSVNNLVVGQTANSHIDPADRRAFMRQHIQRVVGLAQVAEGTRRRSVGFRISTLSHEIMAEMVGATRSRITHFMNKFRKMGLIENNGHARDSGFELVVRADRLTDLVLQDY